MDKSPRLDNWRDYQQHKRKRKKKKKIKKAKTILLCAVKRDEKKNRRKSQLFDTNQKQSKQKKMKWKDKLCGGKVCCVHFESATNWMKLFIRTKERKQQHINTKIDTHTITKGIPSSCFHSFDFSFFSARIQYSFFLSNEMILLCVFDDEKQGDIQN